MSTQALKALSNKRGRIKATITSFAKYLSNISLPLTDEVYCQLKSRLEDTHAKLDQFHDIHSQICDLNDAEDDGEREQFECSFYESRAKAETLINDYDKSLSLNSVTTNSNSSGQVSDLSQMTISKIQLPTILLPTFSGKAEEWLDFKDIFESLIHGNETLNNAKKLHYLRGALQGDAKLVLQGIKTSADNYDAAWACLCDRYQNKRMLIQKHLDDIYSMKALKSECPSALRALLDKVSSHLRALKSLEQPIEHWDVIIMFIIIKKLDADTSRAWENTQTRNSIKSLEELKQFIGNRADMLESVGTKPNPYVSSNKPKPKFDKSFHVSNATTKCYACGGPHAIYYCHKFKELGIEARIKRVAELKLCLNCLRPNHLTKDCGFTPCRTCHKKHNSLLHRNGNLSDTSIISEPSTSAGVEQTCHASAATGEARVLLATATAHSQDATGKMQSMRVLLDDGSQVNLITSKAAQSLGIAINATNKPVGGIGDNLTLVKGVCRVILTSKFSNFKIPIECLVMDKISQDLPQFKINTSLLNLPGDICLSDPQFNESLPIDILLGAGHWPYLQIGKPIKLGPKLPILKNTQFGWVLSGTAPTQQTHAFDNCYHLQNCDLAHALKRFWELEEVPFSKPYSDEEKLAENYYKETVQRDTSGKFMVAIPFKRNADVLGNSYNGALKRFLSLERRLNTNSELKLKYSQFINEYLTLKHMSPINTHSINSARYFLPHHCVINNSSATTRLRVVFDGSFATSSGISRNEIECVGPVVQHDLISILLRFRCHFIAISADITKMYRQILVRPEDRHMQTILWRDNSCDAIQAFELNTVTYGTSSGSFLATRCLVEIANQLKEKDPALAAIIENDFYVDDLLTGANSVDEARSICKRIKVILESYGFPLQKWNSNSSQIFSDSEDIKMTNVNLGSNERTKTLGIHWHPQQDVFSYVIPVQDGQTNLQVTKRSILSSISQIFDPLGLVGPAIILPKMILQRLWQLNLDWDAPVPIAIAQEWHLFKTDLLNLNSLRVSRCIIPVNSVNIQLHGFSDASERGLGACIYARCTYGDSIQTKLICAKSKVSPLKTTSIPRLELCASLILSKLLKTVLRTFTITVSSIFLWTDSEIVLGWLKRQPNTLQTFVANRVSIIKGITENCRWNHVPSRDNPADLISRGVMPSELITSSLWWYGPNWLNLNIDHWPTQNSLGITHLPEVKQYAQANTCTMHEAVIEFERFSSYTRLVRTMAYVQRFINISAKRNHENITTTLSPCEIITATTALIKQVQSHTFHLEIQAIASEKNIKSSSRLKNLRPFLDDKGILRVQGRLQKSNLNYSTINPIILPHDHLFTKLLFKFEHLRLGHSGMHALLYSLREKYWPIRGKSIARKTVHSCISCFRAKPRNKIAVMAPLPSARVNPSPAFTVVGVDYAGPFLIKDRKGRGCKTAKCYIAVFICFSTKAIHVEVVSDYTTDAFIATLRRFVARRGRPHVIWSDNGTNFVGANNELQKIVKNLRSDNKLAEIMSIESITWKFIPSYSPHFGGLWESGVRGVKFHLKRVIGEQRMTFEELTTVCAQIESILNSRPICVLSDDPNDPLPLTPGHFISARKLTSLPEECLTDIPINRLGRYQLLQRMVQDFWTRWRLEYLTSLQPTTKWTSETPSMKTGDLVLVKADNAPPLHWPLGRISDVYKGSDGNVRVASVYVRGHQHRYSTNKLFPLPQEDVCSSSDRQNSLLPDGVLPKPGACSR